MWLKGWLATDVNTNFHYCCQFQVVGENIVGVAVDVDHHYLFWSDLGPTKRGIYRADMDGLQPIKIIETGLYHSLKIIASLLHQDVKLVADLHGLME